MLFASSVPLRDALIIGLTFLTLSQLVSASSPSRAPDLPLLPEPGPVDICRSFFSFFFMKVFLHEIYSLFFQQTFGVILCSQPYRIDRHSTS